MILGESGLGKSTLINSLFLTDLYSADYQGPSHRIQKTVKVGPSTVQATILPLSRPSVYHCSCYWYTTVQAIRLLVYHLDYHYTTVQTTSTPLSKLLAGIPLGLLVYHCQSYKYTTVQATSIPLSKLLVYHLDLY